MEKKIIECKNLNKTFENGVIGVDNVSLSFEKGKFYAIMGHSGSGKTTLLQMIGLLDNLSSGSILINGTDVSNMSSSEKADIRKNVIGFIFQSYFLNPTLKAYENVLIPMLINNNIKNKKDEAVRLLDKFGLNDRIEYYPKKMSGGEQQRVAIARAFANNPSCILADEPTGNLDEENEILVFNYLKKSCQEENKCVIVVSHNPVVTDFADEIIHINKGKVIQGGE